MKMGMISLVSRVILLMTSQLITLLGTYCLKYKLTWSNLFLKIGSMNLHVLLDYMGNIDLEILMYLS